MSVKKAKEYLALHNEDATLKALRNHFTTEELEQAIEETTLGEVAGGMRRYPADFHGFITG